MPYEFEFPDGLKVIHHGSGAIEIVRGKYGVVVISGTQRYKFLEAVNADPYNLYVPREKKDG